MTLVVTHSQVAGTGVDTDAIVDGADWDANHVLTGVISPAQGGTGVVNNDSSTLTISGSFGTTFTVTATTSVTLPTTGTLATLAGSETLTNKTINLASNTLTGTTAEFNTALSDGNFATLAGSETLTNKGINLANNTLTGTTAEFNTALSDNDFATLAGSEALTNKTYNGNTWTAGTGTLTIGAGKTATVSNTLTFTGTDGSTAAFGVGGTVAYQGGTLAQFAGTTSAQLAGVISDETGSGSLVFSTSPTLVTPVLGVATATSINKVALTAPATGSTLTIADGKTLTASNTLTFTGTDASSVAFGTGGTVAYTGGTLAQFAATTSAQLAGVISDETGSGALVFGTGPTIAGATITGVVDAGGATSFEIPNDTAPTVNADGEIAVDTSVTDFSHGILKYYSGEELGVVAMPIAEFTSPSDGAVPTYNATSDEFEMVVPAGAGTVTSVVGNGVTITSTGTIPPPYGLVNHSLAVSAAASALTIALKDNAGSDPSAASPVNGYFRNVTGTTGSWTQLSVTGALSLVISSGSTLGVTSSTAFRLWVVLFNDGGTARLGVINCADSTHIYSLNESVPASSTAEGGAGAADSAGVFYTGTAVTSKSFLIVGYVEWSSSGLTAGTWTTTNLNFVQSFGPGTRKPGEPVGNLISVNNGSGSTTSNTTATDVTGASVSITPTSAANRIRATASAYCTVSAGGAGINSIYTGNLVRTATTLAQVTLSVASGSGTNVQTIGAGSWVAFDSPNTASSTTYKLQHFTTGGTSSVSTNSVNLIVEEIMC